MPNLSIKAGSNGAYETCYPSMTRLVKVAHSATLFMLPSQTHLKTNQAKPSDQKGSLACQADLLLFLPLGKRWRFFLHLDDS